MKKLLLVVLALHVLFETVIGLTLVAAPQVLIPTAQGSEVSGLINQGMCALAMVLLVAWLWPHRANLAALSVALGALATFHSLIIVAAIMTVPALDQLLGYTHHLLLAISFWGLWYKRRLLVYVQ